jgi:small-conductance mechanosensitive channel
VLLNRVTTRALVALLAFVLAVAAPPAAWADEELSADRSTPRRALASFLEAAEARDYGRAAEAMDLHAIPPGARRTRGAELAQQLHYVLERTMWLEPARLSDEPGGRPEDGADVERLGAVPVGPGEIVITLARLRREGRPWAFSSSTVARIPRLYETHGPGPVESRVPGWTRARFSGLAIWQWIGILCALLVAYAVGRSFTWVLTRLLSRVTTRTAAKWDDELLEALRRPARFFFGVIAFRLLVGPLALSAAADHVVSRMVGMVSIGTAAWTVIRVIGVLSTLLERRARAAGAEAGDRAARARGIATQVRVLRRVFNLAVGVIAVALMLTQFEVVRNVGVSLLASAGVAGVVLGFAAQRTIGNLFAGIQLSVTQPIRIGDVVIVENEWGTIEEVTLTFVVVRIWDERRLVVPMSRFLEQPFQNWTKVSPQLLGTIFFYVDWSLPIDEMRKELERIVVGHPKWDGRAQNIQVTDARERVLEVRALISAKNSSDQWDLRVEVRERIVRWLQQYEGGKYLPRTRVVDVGDAKDGRPLAGGAAVQSTVS